MTEIKQFFQVKRRNKLIDISINENANYSEVVKHKKTTNSNLIFTSDQSEKKIITLEKEINLQKEEIAILKKEVEKLKKIPK